MRDIKFTLAVGEGRVIDAGTADFIYINSGLPTIIHGNESFDMVQGQSAKFSAPLGTFQVINNSPYAHELIVTIGKGTYESETFKTDSTFHSGFLDTGDLFMGFIDSAGFVVGEMSERTFDFGFGDREISAILFSRNSGTYFLSVWLVGNSAPIPSLGGLKIQGVGVFDNVQGTFADATAPATDKMTLVPAIDKLYLEPNRIYNVEWLPI